jgi:hypothetical protein
VNEAKLKQLFMRSLGHPVLCVELKPDLQRYVIDETYRWFSANKGLIKRDQVAVTVGTNEYVLPTTILDVLDVVRFLPSDVASFFSGDFYGGFGGIYIGGLGFGGAGNYGGYGTYGGGQGGRDPLPFSGITQVLSYHESVTKILSSEFEWEYFDGTLIISPIPSESGTMIYEYKKALTDISEVKEGSRDQDLILSWAKAEAKEVVGRIRRKYDSVPGAETEISLDGDRLLDDAQIEKEKLNELIRETAMPMGIMAK